MSFDKITYALAKRHTDETVASVKSGIESWEVDGLVLRITTADGKVLEMKFEQPKDGVSVTDIKVNESDELTVYLSDGTTSLAGTVPTVQGAPGEPYAPASVSVSTLENGQNPHGSVEVDMEKHTFSLNLAIPEGRQGIQGVQGEKGDDGYPFLIWKTYHSVSEMDAADFPNVGLLAGIVTDDEPVHIYRYTGGQPEAFAYLTDIKADESIKGDPGESARIEIGDVATLPSGSPATVENSGSEREAVLNFGIPSGRDGDAATVRVGEVSTLPPGSPATVTNAGTAKDAILNFGIPKGDAGSVAGIDYELSETSENAVQNKAVTKSIRDIERKIATGVVYKGSVLFGEIPLNPETGWEYNIKDAFMTDSRFTEGAGIRVAEGTNIVFSDEGLWDLYAASIPVDEELSGESELPVQNKAIKEALDGKVDREEGKGLSDENYTALDKGKLDGIEAGAQRNVTDSKDMVATFESSDVADGEASSWEPVEVLATGEKHASIFSKISKMFRNVRFLFKLMGDTDLSSIGDGTVTGTIRTLYGGKVDKEDGKGLSTDDFVSSEHYTQEQVDAALLGKVDKIDGKGLSTDDFVSASYNTREEVASFLSVKVDKEQGKGLSANDFTNTLKAKLDGIGDGAKANVQTDWNVSDSSSDAFLKNKPSLGNAASYGVVSSVDASNNLPTSSAVKTFVEGKSYVSGVKGDLEYAYRIGNVNITKENIGLGNVANYDQSKAIKSISRNGTTFTATALDGTSTTFTQQDSNTTYSNYSSYTSSPATESFYRASYMNSELGLATALTTTSKTVHGAINELNVQISARSSAKEWGVRVDYSTGRITRLGDGIGANFDNCSPWMRRRCTLSATGSINAYYGYLTFSENGSNGRVMVEQPKFWTKVVQISNTLKEYWISDYPLDGYVLCPGFHNNSGNPVDFIYPSAYEASLWDKSDNKNITDDAQVADFNNDQLVSYSGYKPISGYSQNLTRANARKLANNIGTGWQLPTIFSVGITQLLFLIEYASFNIQQIIGRGVVDKASGSGNESVVTGATSFLGNKSGMADGTNGLVSISYRGEENPCGNIWYWIDGINCNGAITYVKEYGTMTDDTATGYTKVGFNRTTTSNYISNFGVDTAYPNLFLPIAASGTADGLVGDYYWYDSGWRVACLSGRWSDEALAGLSYLSCGSASSDRIRYVGGRLLYVPQ